MERLTTDKPENNLTTALNLFYAKDGEAWVRGGGPWPKNEDVTLNDYIRRAIKQIATCPPMFDELDDQKLAEVMCDWCMDGIESHEGVIGTLYAAGWVCAELRARLKAYEETGLTPEQVSEMQREMEKRNGIRVLIPQSRALTHGEPVILFEGEEKSGIRPLVYRQWIPADMEMPAQEEVGKYYAQYGEHPQYIVVIAHAVRPTVLAFDGEGFYDPATNETYKVTHWMEWPPAPEVNT